MTEHSTSSHTIGKDWAGASRATIQPVIVERIVIFSPLSLFSTIVLHPNSISVPSKKFGDSLLEGKWNEEPQIGTMELYEALQPPLKSAVSGKDVPSAIADRLAYLWQSAHQTLGTTIKLENTKLSHQLSHQFASLAAEYMIDLPDHVKDRMCPRCFIIKLPSINTRVRVVRVGRNSGKNRLLKKNTNAKTKRLKNVICVECITCKYRYKSKPCCLRKGKNKSKIEVTHEISNNNADLIQSKVKFSFLDSIQKAKSNDSKSTMNTPVKSNSFNLIELEKMNKKSKKQEKRNSLTPSSLTSPIGLNALQNLLGSAKKTV